MANLTDLYEGMGPHHMAILKDMFIGNEQDDLPERVEEHEEWRAQYGVLPEDDPELVEHLSQQWDISIAKGEHPYMYDRAMLIDELWSEIMDLQQCGHVVGGFACSRQLGHKGKHKPWKKNLMYRLKWWRHVVTSRMSFWWLRYQQQRGG